MIWTGRRSLETAAACAKGISSCLSSPSRSRTRSSAGRTWPGPSASRRQPAGRQCRCFNTRGDEFFFTPVRADADVYTGLSILNDGPEEIEVIIEAYDANGKLLDATEEALVIAGGASRIGLLRELLPKLGSADGGYVRRIVAVDPDADHRLAGAAGQHHAAASGRADGALAARGRSATRQPRDCHHF